MRRTAIFRDDLFLEHIPGFGHVESPERLRAIYEALDRSPGRDAFLYPAWAPAAPEILALNHTRPYIRRVAETAGRNFTSLDPDTMTSERSFEAACLAAGAAVHGVDLMLRGEAENGFALVRPPGHHAEKDRAMGFCLFNNIAIAARYALLQPTIERVLVVDWDLHHGNGTQHAFYDSDRVFYFSTHLYPYYPGSGALPEAGTGRGEGYTLNLPLPPGQGDLAYARIFRDLLIPVARAYRPDLILVSAGFDIGAGDPLGGMAVSAAGFGYLTRLLVELAGELCRGRLLMLLEGGYHLQGLRDGVLAVLDGLAGSSHLTPGLPAAALAAMERPDIEVPMLAAALNLAKTYWDV